SAERASRTTCAPARAKRRAHSAPIPREAPVMTTTRPATVRRTSDARGGRGRSPRTRCRARPEAMSGPGVVPLAGPDVQLLRAPDLRVRVVLHLTPVRQPAGQAADREQHREHARGEAHRLVDDTRVEVDVRVEAALLEVVVLQR